MHGRGHGSAKCADLSAGEDLAGGFLRLGFVIGVE